MLKSAQRPAIASVSAHPSRRVAAVLAIVLLFAGAGLWLWSAVAAERAASAAAAVSSITKATLHPVLIRRPDGPPMLATGLTNFQGQPVFASCSACHTTTKPNLENRRTEDLDQFHQGLKYNHGNLTCLSCHNSTDYDSLRLADTRSVAFVDSMTLCSQCHGPQRRDYDMGLHGGMNGHWDLKRGGRTRNTCINCHDPHAPAFPLVMPVLPPRDRVSVQKSSASPAHSKAQHP
jgi:formate-dependent nitrite reductase cytochrome c552 subunit